MSPVALIDASVPIYAAGRPHPLKTPSARELSLAAERPGSFLTDAGVLQELLHRCLALGLWLVGRAVMENFGVLMEGRVEAVEDTDVLVAAHLADTYPGSSARGLLHVAVMRGTGIDHIVSADRGIERLDPTQVEWWEETLAMREA